MGELKVALSDDEEEDSPKKKHNKVSADVVCELATDSDGSDVVADDKKMKLVEKITSLNCFSLDLWLLFCFNLLLRI